jgi:hypothetical protein
MCLDLIVVKRLWAFLSACPGRLVSISKFTDLMKNVAGTPVVCNKPEVSTLVAIH